MIQEMICSKNYVITWQNYPKLISLVADKGFSIITTENKPPILRLTDYDNVVTDGLRLFIGVFFRFMLMQKMSMNIHKIMRILLP